MKYRVKNIAIFWENLDYGGMNTFIENLINSKQFKKINIKLITNKNNEGIKSIKRIKKLKFRTMKMKYLLEKMIQKMIQKMKII